MKQPLTVTYVSHASILLDGEFGRLICDPWILNEPIYTFTTWKFPAAVIPPEELTAGLDYLYLSHPHEDHLHIPSLDRFPRDVEVLLPEYTSNPGLRAQTVERTFRALGFNRIRKIRPWESVMLGGNTPFTIIPACKMKWWDWENSGFVLEHHDCKLLNMNDCPSDPELYAEVDRRFGEIDIGFVQYSGVTMFPGCYRMPKADMREASAKRKIGWTQQKNMVELLRVRRLAPFAGDFAWLDERMTHCNWANRATPKLFEDFVRTNYPEKNLDVVIMYPSDTWTRHGGLERDGAAHGRHPALRLARGADILWPVVGPAGISRLQIRLVPQDIGHPARGGGRQLHRGSARGVLRPGCRQGHSRLRDHPAGDRGTVDGPLPADRRNQDQAATGRAHPRRGVAARRTTMRAMQARTSAPVVLDGSAKVASAATEAR